MILWFSGGGRHRRQYNSTGDGEQDILEALPGTLSTCCLAAEPLLVDDSQAPSALPEEAGAPSPRA